jgi:dTDP-3-amino-2,3,6-trideoxy-4-keto-D-glucose/dTDP-3-amino-3,4,6-trideoxy-alpha-D-glucose/dTDP-2,6-dideoxy-D-kanosamine transaminase
LRLFGCSYRNALWRGAMQDSANAHPSRSAATCRAGLHSIIRFSGTRRAPRLWVLCLDEVQAAILSLKLPQIDGWIERRRAIAARHNQALAGSGLVLPRENAQSRHSYYVYVVEYPSDRDGVLDRLAERDINCNVSYRWPIHMMRANADLDYYEGQFSIAERKAQRIFSLPMYPHPKDEEVDAVIDVLQGVI